MKAVLLGMVCGALAMAQNADPLASMAAADLEPGKRLYRHHCALCHGFEGTGGSGPSLARQVLPRASDNAALLGLIQQGIPNTAMPATWQVSEREARQIAHFVRSIGKIQTPPLSGDAGRGAAVYARSGCANCHVVAGAGNGVGPELTAIGLSRAPANLRDSIVNASAVVPPQYRLVRLALNNGSEVRGLRVGENAFNIQVKEYNGRFVSHERSSIKEVQVIRDRSMMPDYKALAAGELDDLVAYLAGLKGTAGAPVTGVANLAGPVSYERLVNGELEAGNWLSYSGSLSGQRYSPLVQINRENAKSLKPVWTYQVSGGGRFETSPVVADGVMYMTEPPTVVTALDASTGQRLWQWRRALPKELQTIGFGQTNRGVAILGDTVFVGTLDAYVVALDAKSGAVRWETKVAENKLGYSITAAPLAIRDKVIIGISGAEAGIRGFIDAYDARTGKLAWRHYTIPAPGEAGHETWTGDAWKTGGGSTWVTGAYEPETNTLFWGVGNPGPDWNGDVRPGDNLYTCSLLAIDAGNGKRRWHFQFTPHDTHDWDATHVPVLFDAEVRGAKRRVVGIANRNAFYYVLDRATGEFLAGTQYAKQTWAKGLDDKGRPILEPGKEPSAEGTLVWPSLNGATVWFSPSYSPQTNLMYVSTRERASVYFKGEAEYKPGTFFAGGGERTLDPDDEWGAIRALEAGTGKLRWEFRLPSPPWAGVMATAGGLVFGGSNEGDVYALDAVTGKALWSYPAGGAVVANPMAFMAKGKQRVALAAGSSLIVFGVE